MRLPARTRGRSPGPPSTRHRGSGATSRAPRAEPKPKEPIMPVDLLIKNGLVVDGTGVPGRHADIAITGGKIAEIGKLGGIAATRTIDAADCVVSPGFIDPHTHYDAQI